MQIHACPESLFQKKKLLWSFYFFFVMKTNSRGILNFVENPFDVNALKMRARIILEGLNRIIEFLRANRPTLDDQVPFQSDSRSRNREAFSWRDLQRTSETAQSNYFLYRRKLPFGRIDELMTQ